MKNISFVALLFIYSVSTQARAANFLTYFDKSISKINIQCRQDSECKLVQLSQPCHGMSAVNIKITKKHIIEYNKKKNKLLNGLEFDCGADQCAAKIKAVCIQNLCTIQTEK